MTHPDGSDGAGAIGAVSEPTLRRETRKEENPMTFEHAFVDTSKPRTGTDIFCADLDGDGLADIVCASWWYAAPDWRRYEIPGIYQALCACDLDGDGRPEIIATRRAPVPADRNWYFGLSAEFVWLKPLDPRAGIWEEHSIGRGAGTWPHGILVAPLLPGGGLAMAVTWHSAKKEGHFPELFIVPENPAAENWPRRTLAEIPYGEDLAAADFSGTGRLDIILGEHLLENDGAGGFHPRRIARGLDISRVAISDMNADGLPDIVFCEEKVDWATKRVPLSRIGWLENPGRSMATRSLAEGHDPDPVAGDDEPWKVHDIDMIRCGHSLSACDLDGDGFDEIICAEHLPFTPHEGDGRLFVYRKRPEESYLPDSIADLDHAALSAPERRALDPSWERILVDTGYEHHDGAKIVDLGGARKGIVSHAWTEPEYVHLWSVR
jgi:hypothetical protein